jgi:transcriptional regulator
MSPAHTDALRGTIELLALRTLALERMHGWGIGQRIQERSGGAIEANQGSLYPALQRLEKKGWIDSEWEVTENGRRAKYYALTAAGRRALGAVEDSWRRFVGAVDLVLAGE